MSIDRDIAMMQNAEKWPRWPFLPVKRPDKVAGFGIECGFLHASDETAVVYLGSIYGLEGKRLSDLPKKQYDSLELLREDGWMID